MQAISYAKQYTEIQDNEIDIIIHAKRTLVFNGEGSRKKKDNNSGFDVTMGSLDGVETCELVVCSMLSLLQPKYGESIGLYRDDGVGDPHNNAKENGESKRRHLQNLPRKRLENHYRSK